MKPRLFSKCAVFCLAMVITGAQLGMAQLLQPQDPQWLLDMYEQGWQKVQEGVLQRSVGEGQIETFTYGEEGLSWTAESLKKRIVNLQHTYDQYPSPELADALTDLRNQLGVAITRLSSGQVEEPDAEQMENCDISYGAHANPGFLQGSAAPGVTASASAYFHNNCGYLGNTYADVLVEAATGTVFTHKVQNDPKYDGTWLDSAASLSLGGSTQCKSTAYARAWSYSLGINYEAGPFDNFSCPPPAPTTSISGPSNVYTDNYYPCADVTWTANPSGGTPGYTYNWYIGGVYQGSGSQLTKQYCYTNATVNVSVQIFDSGIPQQSASASFTTYVSYAENYCYSNPYTCECNVNYCSNCYQEPYSYPYERPRELCPLQ
ncbi:MAG TPA: hypothetical protein VF789_21665 [Thermoanaerobaculia bacterium]